MQMSTKITHFVQRIDSIPDNIKQLYKTVWEISQRVIIKMAADRGPYICQSQSLNIHFAEPDKKKLDSAHFYAWKSVSFNFNFMSVSVLKY